MSGIDTKAVRALADELRKNWRVETADMLRQCADEIDALRGQALSDPEREEYFAMKQKAAEYDTLREELATAQTDRFDELQDLRTENDTLRELVREAKDGLNWNREQDWYKRAEKALGG